MSPVAAHFASRFSHIVGGLHTVTHRTHLLVGRRAVPVHGMFAAGSASHAVRDLAFSPASLAALSAVCTVSSHLVAGMSRHVLAVMAVRRLA
jgi:hypothetical protein